MSSTSSTTRWLPVSPGTIGQTRNVATFIARPDLQFSPGGTGDQCNWVVRDPVRGDHYSLNQEEYAVISLLRLPRTINQLVEEMNARPGLPFVADDLSSFVNRLCTENLIMPWHVGDGYRLLSQSRRANRRLLISGLQNILSFRLPGFDPSSLLAFLRPLGTLLFSPAFFAIAVGAFILTVFFAIGAAPAIAARFPAWQWFVHPWHLVFVVAGYVGVKTLHELGHGLCCQYYGGRVKELGVMFLFFTPCLYCDVSDAWMLPSKRKRVMISLAGVYVELLMSLVFFWLWWISTDTQLSAWLIALGMITSINTLFINGNPLMKFDGYFALSDLWGVPNLAAVSREQLSQKLRKVFFNDSAANGENYGLWLYAIAAFFYRCLVLFALFMGIYAVMQIHQLRALGFTMVVALASLTFGPMIFGGGKTLVNSLKSREKNWPAWIAIGALTLVLALWFFTFPIHHRVSGTASIELGHPERIYAPRAGRLVPQVNCGDSVSQSERVASIESSELTKKSIDIQGKMGETLQRLRGLQLRPESGQTIAAEIEFLNERRSTLEKSQLSVNDELLAMQLLAPTAGTVFPPTVEADQLNARETRLATNFGKSKLEASEQGSFVERGELVAIVGNPMDIIGVLWVSHYNIELVQPEQLVRFIFPHESSVYDGSVLRISQKDTPLDNARSSGNTELTPTFYRVEFRMESFPESVRPGSQVQASIVCKTSTPAGLCYFWLRRLFLKQ